MDRVKSLILLARSRIRLALLLEVVATGLLAAAAVLALLVAVVKLVPGIAVPDAAIYGSAGAACVIASVAVWMMRARSAASDAQVALLLDERLKLDERLTSALAFESSTDVYARAAIADAASIASDGAMRPKVRAAFPVRFPNRGLAGAAAVGALACVQAFVPAYQWPKEEEAPADTTAVAQKKASEEALERITQELESSKALPQDVRDALAQVAKNADPRVGGEPVDEDARREAIRRMSELSNRLEELKKTDSAQRNEALKRDLANLEKQDGALGQFTEDMAKGDFASAKQKLEDLAKEMQSGKMSDAEKAAAADALDKMAKSLENLAAQQESLKSELEKAGLDAQLANNPEALERAINENQNLTEQQREQLKQAVKSSKASQDALKRMANASKNAANKQRQQAQKEEKKEEKKQEQKKDQQQQGQQQGQQGQQGQQNQQQGQQGQQQQGQQGQQQQQQGQQGGQQQGAQQQGQQGQQGQQQQGQQGQQSEQGGQQQGQQGQQGEPQGSPGEQGQQGDGGLSELAQSLSELEMTQQMLEEAEALSQMAQGESESLGEGMCKGGNGQQGSLNQGQPGQSRMNGQRSGAGRAEGGNTGKAKTPTGTKTVKAKTQNAGGDIIARQLIDNPNPEVAESVMPQESIDSAVDGGSGMAVGEDQVPAHLKDAHKHYFGTLKKELGKKGGAAPAGGGGAGAGSSGGSAAPSGSK